MWAQNVLRSFAWTEQRLEAMLHSVLTDDSSDSPDITHIEEPSVCLQEGGEEGEEEVQDFSDDSFFEEDPVERVLDRHLENWFQQRDTTPSPVREQNAFYEHDVEANVGESPSLALDSASPSDLAPASSTGRQFKWGSCAQCGAALHVAVPLATSKDNMSNDAMLFVNSHKSSIVDVLADGVLVYKLGHRVIVQNTTRSCGNNVV